MIWDSNNRTAGLSFRRRFSNPAVVLEVNWPTDASGPQIAAALRRLADGLDQQVSVPLADGAELEQLRDVVILAHELAAGKWVQSSDERLRRIARVTDAVIDASPVMRGFLGRGGPEAGRNLLGGSGSLA